MPPSDAFAEPPEYHTADHEYSKSGFNSWGGSGTGGWVGTGVEWYERTERKRRGIRALKRCTSRQESQDGRCAKELLQKNH